MSGLDDSADEKYDDDDDDDEDPDDGFDEEEEDGSEEEEEAPPARRAAAAPAAADAGARYVPPAVRAAAAAAAAGGAGAGAGAAAAAAGASAAPDARLTRRVRGLLNRLGAANAAAVTAEAAALLREGHTRHAVSTAAVAEVLHALVDGPRASGAYACALAAFLAGLAASGLGPELGARALAAAATALDAARADGDSRAGANVCALLARVYLAGLVPPALLWGMLCHVTGTLQEMDVALTLAVLK
jgi:hypothetical protein